MGKSAKLHKRTPKNLKKPSTGSTAVVAAGGGAQAQAQSAKKKAGLKQKAASKGAARTAAGSGVGVLGAGRKHEKKRRSSHGIYDSQIFGMGEQRSSSMEILASIARDGTAMARLY
ncbi:hypothetical protein B0H10DRAFT_2432104 [Mycena sp. CBHHK59/15]|nr:hypothetical protein B0H10DRAFT_2432104 [Mycena sp. CBHHK59/15]